MTVAYLVLLAIAADAVWTLLTLVVSRLGPDPVGPYVALHREPGQALRERPAGRAALKAEIAACPLPPAPPVRLPRPHKQHLDWTFGTAEYEALLEWHFAGEPNDQAVEQPFAGAGMAR